MRLRAHQLQSAKSKLTLRCLQRAQVPHCCIQNRTALCQSVTCSFGRANAPLLPAWQPIVLKFREVVIPQCPAEAVASQLCGARFRTCMAQHGWERIAMGQPKTAATTAMLRI